MDKPRHVVILGLGNILNKDEGIGVHALWQMQQSGKQWPPDVELVDGGTLGLRLLPYVESATHLIILDAVDAGKEPGELIELRGEEIPLYTGIKLSLHQSTFQEVLGLALARGNLPEHLYLLGIQPIDLSIGAEPSMEGWAAIPRLIRRAEAILREWGITPMEPAA